MSNIIVDFSQRDSKDVRKNGEWSNMLAKPIEVMPGDTMQIKSVYLDTVSANDNIIKLEQDIKITPTCGVYLLDWEDHKRTYKGALNGSSNIPTGGIFIMMKKKQVMNMTAIRFFKTEHNAWGGFTVSLTYEKPDGTRGDTTPIQVPSRDAGANHWDYNINDTIVMGTFRFVHGNNYVTSFEEMKKDHYTKIEEIVGTINKTEYEPFTASHTFTIPKGVYQPDQLAKKLSQEFSRNLTPFNKDWGVHSPFLKVSNEHDFPQTGSASEGPTFFHPRDETKRMTLDANAKYFIGSNQVACEYDAVEQKFKLDINFPFYDGSGNISIWAKRNNDNHFIEINKHGGIWFNDIDTKYADGSSINLFSDIMKFDMNTLLVGIQDNFSTHGNFDYKLLKSNLKESINITGQFFGIDAFIKKQHPHFRDASSDPDAVTATTINYIFASKEFDDEEAQSGYYLIEATANFSSNFIQQDLVRKHISGVVSKYFSYKSYTSATSQSAIPYLHTSKYPMLLSGVKIRILDPNKKVVATNLGKDNTVMFEITRANPIQLTEEEKKQVEKEKKKK